MRRFTPARVAFGSALSAGGLAYAFSPASRCDGAGSVYTRLAAQDAKIGELTLQLLAMQKQDIQTLCGASDRKDWLKAHPEHQAWADGLLAAQRANALAAPARPAGAEKQRLYNGAEQNQPGAVSAALAAGYDPNHEEELHPKFGTTPLMEAAFHGRDEIVQQLIEHNAQLNTQSGYGWTALHYAGQAKQAGCVALLVAAGANRGIKNNKGKTAHDRAVAQGKTAIAELIA